MRMHSAQHRRRRKRGTYEWGIFPKLTKKRRKNRLMISSDKSAQVSLLIRCPNALQNFKTHTYIYIYIQRKTSSVQIHPPSIELSKK